MKCLVLAAGYATRLYPLTENFPKPLLKVNNKTILDYLVDDINNSKKIDEFIIVSNHKFVNFFNEWKNSKKINTKIIVIDDGTVSNETRLGAVKDIELAIKKLNINDDLMVIAGDNLLDFSLCEFIDYFENKKTTCIMRFYQENIQKIKKSAEVVINSEDMVLSMREKPENPSSNWCVPPFYIYCKDDVKMVESALKDGCKYDAPGSFIEYLSKKSKIHSMEMPGNRYDIGTLESYKEICNIFENRERGLKL